MTNIKRYISVGAVVLVCMLLWCLTDTEAVQTLQISQDEEIMQNVQTEQTKDTKETKLITGSGHSFAGVEAVFMQETEPMVSGNDAAVATVSGNDMIPEQEETDEYEQFAIANVDNYVNVRSIPGTDGEILGKMYDGCVAQIISVAEEDEEWLQIVSGSVEGYIKAEYFICGQDAAAVMEDYVSKYVVVNADRLNVREEPSLEAKRVGFLNRDEKVAFLDDEGEWLKVLYAVDKEGYISAEYATITEEYQYAKSLEEERKEQEAKKELEERQQMSEAAAPENTQTPANPGTNYSSNEELRKAIVNRALQFIGYPYVHGGQSLATGTDCSGFTCFIFAEFGYSISRTPGGQYSSAGRNISYEQIQPGDVICYSSNGGASCTHVAIYIGDGMMVHAANPNKGVVTMSATYDMIIAVKNIID